MGWVQSEWEGFDDSKEADVAAARWNSYKVYETIIFIGLDTRGRPPSVCIGQKQGHLCGQVAQDMTFTAFTTHSPAGLGVLRMNLFTHTALVNINLESTAGLALGMDLWGDISWLQPPCLAM